MRRQRECDGAPERPRPLPPLHERPPSGGLRSPRSRAPPARLRGCRAVNHQWRQRHSRSSLRAGRARHLECRSDERSDREYRSEQVRSLKASRQVAVDPSRESAGSSPCKPHRPWIAYIQCQSIGVKVPKARGVIETCVSPTPQSYLRRRPCCCSSRPSMHSKAVHQAPIHGATGAVHLRPVLLPGPRPCAGTTPATSPGKSRYLEGVTRAR